MLLRLYFDGADEIAWHTDGRTFLGPTPTIASLSFGAEALFQMRRMRNVWPCAGDNGIDTATPIRDFPVGDGEKDYIECGDSPHPLVAPSHHHRTNRQARCWS